MPSPKKRKLPREGKQRKAGRPKPDPAVPNVRSEGAGLIENPWTHRAAWALALTTFPLIWMGGLVTTYGAGMAVPDWPHTFGYNLFLYPPASWLKVGDVFLEHSHRLLGATVGLVSIALAVLLLRFDRRRAVRWLGVIAVAGVCLQGTLGGLRVVGTEIGRTAICGLAAPLFLALAAGSLAVIAQVATMAADGRRSGLVWFRVLAVAALCFLGAKIGLARAGDKLLLAKLHGSSGPLVFVLAAALVTLTSPAWLSLPQRHPGPESRRLKWLAVLVTAGIYVQIVLGVQLRHIPPAAAPWWFTLWVWLHLVTAGAVLVGVISMCWGTRRLAADAAVVTRRVWLMTVLLLLQILLGAATWVTNYGWPRWFTEYVLALQYTILAEGPLQVILTTAHVAFGSLSLAAAASLALWAAKLKDQ